METTRKKTALKKLLLLIGIEMLFLAFFVWLMDPFYQYHAPFFGMEAVLNDRDNQMPGTIRNFDYDSILLGSSVAENFDSSFLDETYGCRTLKAIRASGSVADLLYYLEMAQEKRELKNIFWCLDIPAVGAPLEVTLYRQDIPRYLHTKTILDDLPYLFNKEVLLEKIPSMLAYAREGINTGGQAYNWARNKVFGAEQAMRAYNRAEIVLEGKPQGRDYEAMIPLLSQNIERIRSQVTEHPETQYRFLIPPFSMLWWDCAYVNGELEERLYALDRTVSALMELENVEIYYFQNETSIVCNLEFYMDMIHYAPEINQFMLDRMAAGENRVDRENWGDTMEGLRELVDRITQKDIYWYYNL